MKTESNESAQIIRELRLLRQIIQFLCYVVCFSGLCIVVAFNNPAVALILFCVPLILLIIIYPLAFLARNFAFFLNGFLNRNNTEFDLER